MLTVRDDLASARPIVKAEKGRSGSAAVTARSWTQAARRSAGCIRRYVTRCSTSPRTPCTTPAKSGRPVSSRSTAMDVAAVSPSLVALACTSASTSCSMSESDGSASSPGGSPPRASFGGAARRPVRTAQSRSEDALSDLPGGEPVERNRDGVFELPGPVEERDTEALAEEDPDRMRTKRFKRSKLTGPVRYGSGWGRNGAVASRGAVPPWRRRDGRSSKLQDCPATSFPGS